MSSTGNSYSNEFKQQIGELNQSGSSVCKLSREYGIPTGPIYKWIKDFTSVVTEDGKSVTPREIKTLEKRIRELEIENEILQKRDCQIRQKTIKDKVDFIELLKYIYPIKMMCKLLHLNRSTVYKTFTTKYLIEKSKN